MAKELDFWKHLCDDLEYRFFTGIPFEAVGNIYDSMDSKRMHYVPAANEHLAVKLSSGAWLSGFKSAIILESSKINKIDIKFNIDCGIPLLFITSKDEQHPINNNFFVSNNMEKAVKEAERGERPVVFVLE